MSFRVSFFVPVCTLGLAVCFTGPARAQQTPEVKEKPPMYTYVSDFNLPRAKWGEMDKLTADDAKVLDRAVADGTIIAYGDDRNLVHQADGYTHDTWWSAMSMAGVLNVLDQMVKSNANTSSSSPLLSATKHEDAIYVSRFYNWKPGARKDLYTYGGTYKLKAEAPDDALEMLSKTTIVPLLEKLLADGTLVEYEIDTEAVHSEAPGKFFIFLIAANAEAIDKFRAAQQEAIKSSPLFGPAFDSMTDYTGHRDMLARTNATYK
jgi:hypothetical protein